MSRSWPRVMSPAPGRSTLMTSAPNQARSCVQVGPDWTWVKSRTRTPSSAFIVCSSSLPNRALRVEIADAAAFCAGRRIDHCIDESGPAGIHRFVDRAIELVRRRGIHARPAEGLHHLVVAGVLHEDGGSGIAASRIDVGAAIDA